MLFPIHTVLLNVLTDLIPNRIWIKAQDLLKPLQHGAAHASTARPRVSFYKKTQPDHMLVHGCAQVAFLTMTPHNRNQNVLDSSVFDRNLSDYLEGLHYISIYILFDIMYWP